jgi:hypothetical protein
MVDRIVALYSSGDASQIARGNAWYPTAHDIAEMIGDGDVRMGAGILAALSVMKRWDMNVDLAYDAASGNVWGHTGPTLDKVRAIMDGTPPENVLPMDLKTGNFYRCIVDPEDPEPIVIDRWAYRTATGDYETWNHFGLSNKNRYASIALAYRLAARVVDDIPQRVQARCWVIEKDREDDE